MGKDKYDHKKIRRKVHDLEMRGLELENEKELEEVWTRPGVHLKVSREDWWRRDDEKRAAKRAAKLESKRSMTNRIKSGGGRSIKKLKKLISPPPRSPRYNWKK